MQKRCKKCVTYKEVNLQNFNQANLTKDGLSNTCKPCELSHRKLKAEEYRRKIKERWKEKKQTTVLKPPPEQNELDRLFSLIIRAAHPKFCHACGLPQDNLQAGHYISRSHFAVRFDLRNALPVCVTCNYFVDTHVNQLALRLIELYGVDIIDALQIKRIESFKASQPQKQWLQAMFRTLLKSLNDDTNRNIEKLIETQKMIDTIFCKI